jgi:hypothetical protein
MIIRDYRCQSLRREQTSDLQFENAAGKTMMTGGEFKYRDVGAARFGKFFIFERNELHESGRQVGRNEVY